MVEHSLAVIKYAKSLVTIKTGYSDRLDSRYHTPSQTHDPIRTSGGWACSVCCKSWTSKPRTKCIGVPILDSREALAKGLKRLCEAIVNNERLKSQSVPVGSTNFTSINSFQAVYDLWFSADSFELALADLPPIIRTRSDRAARPQLKSMDELRDLDLRPRIGAIPAACYHYDTLDNGDSRWRLLYALDDCIEGFQSEYITKTRLMQTYSLSEKWIELLGRPDLTMNNPHYKSAAPMLLYKRERVETLLAERADEYATWLEDHKKRVAIARKIAARTKETKARIREQTKLCVKCASAWVGDRGFWCAVHPTGWLDGVPQEFYCPDYYPRSEYRGTR